MRIHMLGNRRMGDALTMVVKAAELAVSQGRYPTLELALFETAANLRKAVLLDVDLHDLLKDHERGD